MDGNVLGKDFVFLMWIGEYHSDNVKGLYPVIGLYGIAVYKNVAGPDGQLNLIPGYLFEPVE